MPNQTRSDGSRPEMKPIEDAPIPLEDAIERFGSYEMVGGDSLTLGDLKEFYPGVKVLIEPQFDVEGKPYFEVIWTDITDLGGPPYPVPQVPAGNENSILRKDDRLFLVSWFD